MFRCKFCHEYKEDNQEASAHKGLCKQCHSANTRYRRLKAKPKLDAEDVAFIERYERLCRHNEMVGGYVPKQYYSVSTKTVDRCPCCGMFNAVAYPSNPSMCYDCGVLENNYRYLLHKLKKPATRYDVYVSRVAKVMEIERKYMLRHKAGLQVPSVYLANRGSDGFTTHNYKYTEPEYIYLTSEAGKQHKLRVGATCRKCGVELNELNWSLGNGNICKSCINEYHKARRKGIWSW